jgi:MraZ protein
MKSHASRCGGLAIPLAWDLRGRKAPTVQPFISTVVNKLDAKGRVSVPAPFRQVLAQQSFRGFYCFPSFAHPALEAFGEDMLADIQARLTGDPFFSDDFDARAQAIIGECQMMNLDDEGRIRLPDEFLAHAQIKDRVLFTGMIKKFQIWEPGIFEPIRKERIARALASRTSGEAA